MAASKLGTCDASVSKMLCLHIPSLLPLQMQMDVSSVAQIAAVAGVGMLYLGSAHRLMTEFLLGRSGGSPGDKIADREAYVLSAGFALGMVNLGKVRKHDQAERAPTTPPVALGLVVLHPLAPVAGQERGGRRTSGSEDRGKAGAVPHGQAGAVRPRIREAARR